MVSRSRSSSTTSDGSGSPARSRASSFSSVDSDDRSPLHDAAYRNDVKRLRLILTTCAVDPNLETLGSESGKTPLHWLCLRYDSLIADITRKVAEMASLKGPRASSRAAKLSAALEADLDETDDDDTACS